ncbi:hypothetical protein M5K25_005705 [Dendrobium thyrsiflorum]|uniref:Uncharacterized protein n=1 Tax=Dendrobium thyrsiflorum TaxID=117978 RepID=A0ABD0VQU4_DENTH
MADPDVDHGFVYDDQGRTDILGSPFFDVHFGNGERLHQSDSLPIDLVNRRTYLAGTLVPHLPPTDLSHFGYCSNDYNPKLLPSLGGITKCGLLASPSSPTKLKRDAIGPKVKTSLC